MALYSAKVAGCDVDAAAVDGGIAFLDRSSTTTNDIVSLRFTDGSSKAPTTSAGTWEAANLWIHRVFKKWKPSDAVAKAQTKWLAATERTSGEKCAGDPLLAYLAGLAVFQDTDAWNSWAPNEPFKQSVWSAVLGAMDRKSDDKSATYGSWDSLAGDHPFGGRVIATALNAMALQTNYRFRLVPG